MGCFYSLSIDNTVPSLLSISALWDSSSSCHISCHSLQPIPSCFKSHLSLQCSFSPSSSPYLHNSSNLLPLVWSGVCACWVVRTGMEDENGEFWGLLRREQVVVTHMDKTAHPQQRDRPRVALGTSSLFHRDPLAGTAHKSPASSGQHGANLSPSYAGFTYLHVIQQTLKIQTPLGSIPVVVGSNIFKASIHKHRVVVL